MIAIRFAWYFRMCRYFKISS